MNQQHSFTVIDDNANFVVVEKPANLSFQDDDKLGSGFFNQVKIQLGYSELYPVHRLDKITSGLVLLAKNLPAAQSFQKKFEQGDIEKFYLAISDQKPKKKQGMIKGDMAKSRRSAWKLLRTTNTPAITQFFSYSIGSGLRAYLVKPKTGKTHQIRVALASIGAPILGDSLYGGADADRGYLHAFQLSFELFGEHYQYQKLPTEGEKYQLLKQVKDLENPEKTIWPKA